MPVAYADRLKFASTGTSAATLTPGAAATACRTLAQAIADGAMSVGAAAYFAVTDGTNWEDSLFTIGGTAQAPTLTRTQVLASSAGGTTAATFNGSALTVFNTVPGSILSRVKVDSDVPFSASIPLTQPGVAYMAQTAITGALTFTPAAGAVKGALCWLRLVANGSNTPDFTAFKLWGGGADYNNGNGVVNVIQFFYDGTDYWYSLAQAAGAAPIDNTPPTVTSAAVANSAPSTLVLTASEPLSQSFVPAASAFAVDGHTVTGVTLTTNTINLALGSAFVNGEAARTVSYTQPGSNGLRDVAGNLMASFAGMSVTNNVAAVDNSIRLSPRSSDLSESSGAPWVYTGSGAVYSDAASNYVPYQIGGVATKKLQSGVDGSLAFALTGIPAGSEIMLGLSTSASVVGFSSFPCAFFTQASSSKYVPFTSGNSNTASNSVTPANNDIMRMRRVGTTIYAEVSKDGGSTFTTIYTWTGVSASAIYFQCVVGTKPGTISNLNGVGLA